MLFSDMTTKLSPPQIKIPARTWLSNLLIQGFLFSATLAVIFLSLAFRSEEILGCTIMALPLLGASIWGLYETTREMKREYEQDRK